MTEKARWSSNEVATLKRAHIAGKTIPQICRLLPGRSAKAIKNRINRMCPERQNTRHDASRKVRMSDIFRDDRAFRAMMVNGNAMYVARLHELGWLTA